MGSRFIRLPRCDYAGRDTHGTLFVIPGHIVAVLPQWDFEWELTHCLVRTTDGSGFNVPLSLEQIEEQMDTVLPVTDLRAALLEIQRDRHDPAEPNHILRILEIVGTALIKAGA